MGGTRREKKKQLTNPDKQKKTQNYKNKNTIQIYTTIQQKKESQNHNAEKKNKKTLTRQKENKKNVQEQKIKQRNIEGKGAFT